jgi:hypothetical protein
MSLKCRAIRGEYEESNMVKSKESKRNLERLAAPLKAAVWIAVLGFVVLAVEAPHWISSADTQNQVAQAPTSARTSSIPASGYSLAQLPAPKVEATETAPSILLCGGC